MSKNVVEACCREGNRGSSSVRLPEDNRRTYYVVTSTLYFWLYPSVFLVTTKTARAAALQAAARSPTAAAS